MIKKTTRTVNVIEIDGKELGIIRHAIIYAYHRAKKHGKESEAGSVEELKKIKDILS